MGAEWNLLLTAVFGFGAGYLLKKFEFKRQTVREDRERLRKKLEDFHLLLAKYTLAVARFGARAAFMAAAPSDKYEQLCEDVEKLLSILNEPLPEIFSYSELFAKELKDEWNKIYGTHRRLVSSVSGLLEKNMSIKDMGDIQGVLDTAVTAYMIKVAEKAQTV